MRNLLLLLALSLPLSARAASVGRAYIPNGGGAELTAVHFALKISRSYGPTVLTRDMLHPLALSLTSLETVQLQQLVAAAVPDKAAIDVIMYSVIARAKVFAAATSARFMMDEAQGKIADEDLQGSQDFAQRYLTAFGLYLEPAAKAEFLKTAAKLEQRRLKLEERRTRELHVVMKSMVRALSQDKEWNAAVVGPAAQDLSAKTAAGLRLLRPDAVLPLVKRRYGPLLSSAVESGDPTAFGVWVKAAYRSLKAGLLPGLDLQGQGMAGPRELAFLASAQRQAEQLHAFISDIRSANPNEAFGWANDSGRKDVLALIREKSSLSRYRAGDIEAKLPVDAFKAIAKLQGTDDGSIVKPLSEISSFYDQVLGNARYGSAEYKAYALKRVESGFDGRVAKASEVSRIWKDALKEPANAAARQKVVRRLSLATLLGAVVTVGTWVTGLILTNFAFTFASFGILALVISLYALHENVRVALWTYSQGPKKPQP